MTDQEEEQQQPSQLNWRWSWWDVAGIATNAVGNLLAATAQGAHLLSQEFAAMANWSRDERQRQRMIDEEEAHRKEMADAYERLVGMDNYWLTNGDDLDAPREA